MAINSFDVPGDKAISKLQTSSNGFKTGAGNLSTCRLVKIDFAEDSIYSAASRHSSKKSTNAKSPYLSSDNVHLLSQVTEKTYVHKKDTGFSSFPLAVNIYKASSDEFKSLKRSNKKAKKSVLTLPNDQAPMPQICTVSDINDSEYFNQDDDHKKLKKRNPVTRNRKSRPRGRDYEFYDRDARYCSQMNINLDCSSTDMIQNYNEHTKRGGKPKSVIGNKQIEEKPNPHDVWAVLRNINRFQFRPSPPMSEDSFISPKKKKGAKRRNNRKDMRVVETCRTEEFAYISSFEVDSRSPQSFSKSSSFDRITVIDKQDDFSKICKEFEKRMVKTKNYMRGSNRPQNKNLNKPLLPNNNRTTVKPSTTKSLAPKKNSPKALEYNPKKQYNNNNCGDTKHNKIVNKSKDCPELDNNKNEFGNPMFKDVNDNQFLNDFDEEINVEQEFIYSGSSGGKATNIEANNRKVPGKTKLDNESLDDFNTLNGITKVILSKGPITPPPPKKPETPKRIRQASMSRPVAPKSTINTVIPKLTQTDIKRRLARLKFPIVILGKDQLSSNYEVPNPESIQFDGLNEQVWPFMVRWQKGEKGTLQTKPETSPKKKLSPEILEYTKTQKMNRGFSIPKQHNSDKKNVIDVKNKNVTKIEQKRITPPAELQQQTLPKKSKPIHQLKEKVLKLLYKNSSTQNVAGENKKTGGHFLADKKPKPARKFASMKIDASTDTHMLRTSPKDVPRRSIDSPVKIDKQAPATRQPWAKAKWASDFIDNVIRKIKTGVYYTQESKQVNVHECKEAEIQTNAEDNPVMKSISKITIKKKKEPIIIPGFDDNSLPPLEIKTMNSNEISVKHCVTNIMVHFDVTVPNVPVINLKKSSSLIPLQAAESQTKIFKCKTSIINAMLPAELCSILPKMMWNIIESRQATPLPSISLDKTLSHLSTISEITRCESPDTLKFPFYCHLPMTLELQNLINGYYATIIPKRKRVKCHENYNSYSVKEILPQLSRNDHFDIQAKKPCLLQNSKQKQPMIALEGKIIDETPLKTCAALQPYPTSDIKVVQAYQRFDVTCWQKISSYVAGKLPSWSKGFSYIFDKNITINLTTINHQGLENRLSIDIGKLFSSTYENITNVTDTFQGACKGKLPAIQCIELKVPLENVQSQSFVNNKTKKKGFLKLYRKCKSASNISAEKNTTSLSKITCLDDFFQALGTAKLLSGVFDSVYDHKILSSLKEMKSWITEINPTQALLLLLLVNKKDTPNLVRFRPVLLQGIAVNRITRANELDMEIEVIERENLNRLTQYEGISYMMATTENQDNLLEELCWIAKTTASDYQRTFDESSEKLLKSLLEKRKKLNPSYLRVMARYVGLGLLKSPIKK